MDCLQYREQYSEFADGFLDEAAEISMIRHAAECEACRRHDAGYRAGSSLLRELPALAVSADFQDRLQARIMASLDQADAVRWRRWPAGILALFIIVAAAGWQAGGHAGTAAAVEPGAFIMTLAEDSTFSWPARVPARALAGDSFPFSTRPAPSFQIAVDYMIVP